MLDLNSKYAYTMRMKTEFNKKEVVEMLGGIKSASKFFGISSQAISQWPDNKPIPKQRQYECILLKPELFVNQPNHNS